jgi:cytidylate kinase
MRFPLTEKLIQRQINHWNHLRETLREQPSPVDHEPGPVITISRLAGSGGRTLAAGLAERLGCDVHDQSIVERIARTRRLSPELVALLDEQDIRQTDLWVRGVLENRLFLKEQYREALTETVLGMAAAGNAVILGRGAGHILGHRATLRVRLVAGTATRLARLQERTGLARAEARAQLEETDRRREAYVRKLLGVDPHDAAGYDLVVNTDRLLPNEVVELVLVALVGAARQPPRQLAAPA